MEHIFKKDDPIVVVNGSNWLVGKKGFVIEVLDKPIECPFGLKNRSIVVHFPGIPLRHFPSYGNSNVPEEEWGLVGFAPENLSYGHPALTEEEQIEEELKGFGGMRPHSFYSYEREDKKCVCEGCSNDASTHIWINIWGNGYREHVCTEHAKEYKLCTCADGMPFKIKPSDRVKQSA